MDDMEDFLNAGTEPLEQTTESVAPEPETIGQPRGDDGRFAPKQTETGVEPQATAHPVPPTGLPQEEYKAVREEREKRQALERELHALKAQQAPPTPPPSLWEDEEGALQHNRQQAVSEASFNARLDMSEMLAAQAHEDFDAMKAKFVEMMAINPALQQQALEARHPWEHAYQTAKNAARFEEIGATNVSELEAKLREQIKAEMAAQAPTRPTLPTSLADNQSARVSHSGAAQMMSLDDIINRR